MHNMINMFLTQARQTIINTKIALESVRAVHYRYSNYDSFTGEINFAGPANANTAAADITPGFHSGEGLPVAWE